MITNNDRYAFVVEFAGAGRVRYMSSGKPVCPICDNEHDDGNDFDTITVCKDCTPDIRLQPNIYVLRKIDRRFECDIMAFRNRKQILLEYMQKYANKTGSDDDYLYHGMPKGIKRIFPEKNNSHRNAKENEAGYRPPVSSYYLQCLECDILFDGCYPDRILKHQEKMNHSGIKSVLKKENEERIE